MTYRGFIVLTKNTRTPKYGDSCENKDTYLNSFTLRNKETTRLVVYRLVTLYHLVNMVKVFFTEISVFTHKKCSRLYGGSNRDVSSVNWH